MSIQDDIQKTIVNNELYAIDETVFADWKQAFDTYIQLAKQGDAILEFKRGDDWKRAGE